MNIELKKIAVKHQLNFLPWGIEGGNGWIWYKQDDEKKFRIQISVHGKFEVYNSIKSEVVDLLLSNNCSLSKEEDIGTYFGYRRILYFMDTEELHAQINKKEKLSKISPSSVYNIGQINADGGIVTLGNIIDSTQNIDNSIKQIEYLIEEKGGDDKEELYAALNEAKDIIKEISEKREIQPQKRFVEKLGNHFKKHSWFYEAIVRLLGTTLLTVLG